MVEKKEKEKKKQVNMSKGLGKFTLFLILAVLFWNTVQIWMMSSVVNRVDQYNEGAVTEMGKMMGDVKLFAEDLNQIRRFLLLPERDYSVVDGSEEKEAPNVDELSKDSSKGLYAFLDQLKDQKQVDENRSVALPVYDGVIANADFWNTLVEADLRMGERSDLQVKLVDNRRMNEGELQNELFNQPLYNLVFAGEKNIFKVQSALGEEEFKEYTSESFVGELQDYLVANVEEVRKKKLEQIELEKQEKEKAEQVLAQAELDKFQELDDLVVDEAFVDLLKGMALTVKDGMREEPNKRVYDVITEEGKVEFSLALEISSGMIKVVKDGQEIDIESFLDDGSKKKS